KIALAGGFLTDEAVKSLSSDTKGSCIVQVQLSPKNWGKLEGMQRMQTTSGELETEGYSPLFATSLGGFAFANVPKGPFRVSYIHYKRMSKPPQGGRSAEWENQEFDLLGVPHAGWSGRGEVPVEMSGTCNGGFIYLGLFKGEGGGVLLAPGFRL